MKKIFAVTFASLFIFLCACNNTAVTEDTTAEENTTEAATLPPEATTAQSLEVEELEPAKVLIVYFSHNDPIEGVAQYISEKTEGGLHKIETLKEYPENEAELLKTIADEHIRNARPALENSPVTLSEYDIVFLCFPAWDGTMPMALFTFIEDYDMRDKAVLPVVYGTEEDLRQATVDIHNIVPAMMIVNGFTFMSDFSVEQSEFDSWINTALYG